MRGIVPNLSIGFRDSRCLCSGARAPGSWAEGLGRVVLGTAEGMGKLPNREEDGPAWEGHLGWALDSGGAASALSPPIGGGPSPTGVRELPHTLLQRTMAPAPHVPHSGHCAFVYTLGASRLA